MFDICHIQSIPMVLNDIVNLIHAQAKTYGLYTISTTSFSPKKTNLPSITLVGGGHPPLHPYRPSHGGGPSGQGGDGEGGGGGGGGGGEGAQYL